MHGFQAGVERDTKLMNALRSVKKNNDADAVAKRLALAGMEHPGARAHEICMYKSVMHGGNNM